MQKQHPKIVYQVYPKSFADTNNDGIGDLKGIIGKLDYLKSLSVDTIWICPCFASPMKDNGYDISDYRAIAPEFGDMQDLQLLIDEAKKRGIGVLLDLVLNHSSSEHKWFKAALADKNSKYRNYYIFKQGQNGEAPNNWRSNFGGSAWEKVDDNEYYLHVFAKEQPDLNWENPELRRELIDMICSYLKMGVAGFRIDAISVIKKEQDYHSLPEDDKDGLACADSCWTMRPGIEKFLAQMRDEAFEPYNAYTVAEAYGVPLSRLPEFVGEHGYFSAVFDFSYTDIDLDNANWYTCHKIPLDQLKKAVFASQIALSTAGHGAVYFENHDQNRSCNKYLAKPDINNTSKCMLGAMYFFLQGTAFIYQGQELGIPNHPWSSITEFDDIATKDQYSRALNAGYSPEQALSVAAQRSRDNSRTPMLWNNGKNAGFTRGEPWLPVHPDYPSLNVEAQEAENSSVLSFYKAMARLRQGDLAELFYDGNFAPMYEENSQLFAYKRTLKGIEVLVVCNFSSDGCEIDLPKSTVLIGNLQKAQSKISGNTVLKAFEALVLLVEE